MPTLIGSVVVTEAIFRYPGLGFLYVYSLQTVDYRTVLGILLVFALTTWAVNVLTHIVSGLVNHWGLGLDPDPDRQLVQSLMPEA